MQSPIHLLDLIAKSFLNEGHSLLLLQSLVSKLVQFALCLLQLPLAILQVFDLKLQVVVGCRLSGYLVVATLDFIQNIFEPLLNRRPRTDLRFRHFLHDDGSFLRVVAWVAHAAP